MQERRMPNGNPAYGNPAGPPVTENDLHVIQRTRELLDSPGHWNRTDSQSCAPNAPSYSLSCALEAASREVNGSFDQRSAAAQEVRFAIDEFVGNGVHYNSRLRDFNNDPNTRFEDIQQVLRNVENNLTERLADQAQQGQAQPGPGARRADGRYGQDDRYNRDGDRDPRYQQPQGPPANVGPLPATLTLPPGTMISVRTTNFLSSNRNKAGEAFTTTLEQPIIVGGWVVARRGQPMIGRIVEAKKEKGESRLGVELASLTLADGSQIPVKTELVKNVRPNAGVGGREIAGVGATTGVGALIGGAADGGEGAGVGAGIGAAAGIVGVLLTRGRPVVIPPESVLMFRTDEPITINTEQSQVAFQPVSQDDYGNSRDDRRGPVRPAYGPYGRPAYPPPGYYAPYPYYAPYYAPYPYYGYGYGYPLPLTFGFGYGFGFGRRFRR